MPERIIRIEADKPAEQQVVVQLFHQHPLRADAVDRLQQQGQQQLLGRDRGPAALGVEPAEGGIEPIERLIRQPPHLPQGMGLGDPILRGEVREKRTVPLLRAAHPFSAVGLFSRGWLGFSAAS